MRHGLIAHPPSLQSPPLLPASSHCYQPLPIAAIHLSWFSLPHPCHPSLMVPVSPIPASRSPWLPCAPIAPAAPQARPQPCCGSQGQRAGTAAPRGRRTKRGSGAPPLLPRRNGTGRGGGAAASHAGPEHVPSFPPRRELTLLGFLLPGQGPAELAQERLLFLHPVRPQRRGAEGRGGHRLCRGSPPGPARSRPAAAGPAEPSRARERGITGPRERGQPAVCARSTGGGLEEPRPQRPATAGKSAGGGGGTSLGHPRGRAPSPPEQHLRPGGRAPPPGHLVRRTHAGAGKKGRKASRQNNTPGTTTAGPAWC